MSAYECSVGLMSAQVLDSKINKNVEFLQQYKKLMRFTELKTLNTSLNPLAPPPATPAMHPHCQGDPPPNDHQIQNPIRFRKVKKF